MSEAVVTYHIDGSFSDLSVKLANESAERYEITRGPPKKGETDDPTDGVESRQAAK